MQTRPVAPSLAAALALTLTLGLAVAPRTRAATTGRLLVTMRSPALGSTARASAAAATLAAAGVRVAGPVDDRLRLLTVAPRHGVAPRVAAAALRALPGVARVEVEHRATLRALPNDPALTAPETAPGTPPGTTVEWWAARENLPAMWAISRGAHATVAVIDTGADASHPELATKIDGTIDNDDTSGDGPATVDEAGHGTHVASLACARANDGIALAGAGLDCRLLIIKSDLSDSSVATSIRQAVDRGADAINMSFGTDGTSPAAAPIVAAIDYAARKGVILVAAAADTPVEEQGDPSNVLQPSGSGADITRGKGLSVTSAGFNGERSPFAGLGSQISLAAFGSFGPSGTGPRGILGAFPRNATQLEQATAFANPCNCRTSVAGDNRYAYIQGTSMAAPMVTAVAAVVRHLNPDLSAPELLQVLKQTATRPPGTGWTPALGWGVINGGAAAAAVRTIDRRPPVSSVTAAAKVVRGRTVALRISRKDLAPAGCVPSGVRRVELWRSANGGRARRLLTTTAATVRVAVRRGSRYAFHTIAIDRAGNREAAPKHPDATVRGAA